MQLFDETLITMGQAAELLGCSAQTVRRFMMVGTAEGIMLEHVRAGTWRKTSREAIRRFLEAQNGGLMASGKDARSSSQKASREQKRARKELEEAGWVS